MPEPPVTPANEHQHARAAVISELLENYCEHSGIDTPDVRDDAGAISCLVADIRHWCDVHDVDFTVVELGSSVVHSAELPA